MDIIGSDLSHISPDILAQAVVRLEEIKVATKLTLRQVEGIFNKIADCENFALKRLNMYRKDLSSVPAEVLVKVISSMETVDLRFAHLTPAQINNIFTLVAERKSSKLRKVHFWKNDISSVPDGLRERAMNSISVTLTFKAEII